MTEIEKLTVFIAGMSALFTLIAVIVACYSNKKADRSNELAAESNKVSHKAYESSISPELVFYRSANPCASWYLHNVGNGATLATVVKNGSDEPQRGRPIAAGDRVPLPVPSASTLIVDYKATDGQWYRTVCCGDENTTEKISSDERMKSGDFFWDFGIPQKCTGAETEPQGTPTTPPPKPGLSTVPYMDLKSTTGTADPNK